MYYKLPFDFAGIMEGQDAHECTVYESIAQHLQLLVTTRYGENRYDKKFGNNVWEHDFDKTLSNSDWEDVFSQSLTEAINQYETRLVNSHVAVYSELVEKTWPLKNYTEVKKKATVLIRSTLAASGERYTFKTEIFVSPLSAD